jgi:hypothetical protein
MQQSLPPQVPDAAPARHLLSSELRQARSYEPRNREFESLQAWKRTYKGG